MHPQLWVNSRADWFFFSLNKATSLGEGMVHVSIIVLKCFSLKNKTIFQPNSQFNNNNNVMSVLMLILILILSQER